MAVAPQTAEQIERRLSTQRTFALWSFKLLCLFTVVTLSFGLSSEVYAARIEKMSTLLMWFYITFGGVIAAYFGSSAFVSKAGK